MTKTSTPPAQPPFHELLARIDDRSAALRKVLAGTDPGARVPGCPDWSLRDLVAHLGEVHRFWAAVVTAGPAEKRPEPGAVGDTTPQGDLAVWSAESTALLLAALEAAGPEAGCWTWWGASGAPMTAGAVARHQVQEAAVHARDAQEAAGRPEPLPAAVAVDAIDEFLTVEYGTCGAWPHSPARVALHTAEGPSWLLDLTPSGAAPVPAGAPADGGQPPAARLHGPAGDLLLALYGRLPLDRLRIDGDRTLIDRLLAWSVLD
ncbi:maleylpyruvate isomerase family mycothiol-dependent enzyme [Streptomyces sp. NBC_01537]|uniref:maleylpyruvate isomerase family mycothiol-dependent enzyme n=1 Tax=Streptomyces sp. NBC_01537 TaxID=2903896 RepID=UPI003865C2C8